MPWRACRRPGSIPGSRAYGQAGYADFCAHSDKMLPGIRPLLPTVYPSGPGDHYLSRFERLAKRVQHVAAKLGCLGN